MLRKFAAVLLATSLIAGPAFAAGTARPAPAPASVGTSAKAPVAKSVTHKHKRKHARRHAVRGNAAAMNQTRHVKHSISTHRAHVAKSSSKTSGKGIGRRASVQAAKLPATRTGTN